MNKNNIMSIIFLLLMTASGFYVWKLYSKVELQKKQLAESEKKLIAKTIETEKFQRNKDKVYDSISYLISSNENFVNNNTLKEYFIRAKKHGDSSLKFSNSSAYQQALQLEREGFTALVKNDFDKALDKFNAAEKASPSFHMCSAISRLLKSERQNFADPRRQEMLKRRIIEKFSWGAPLDLLNKLKNQITPLPSVNWPTNPY